VQGFSDGVFALPATLLVFTRGAVPSDHDEQGAAVARCPAILSQVFTPEDRGHIDAPTLLPVGEEEKLYAPGKAIVGAERLIPDVTTVLVRGAGPTRNMERPATVSPGFTEFLTRRDSEAPLLQYLLRANNANVSSGSNRCRAGDASELSSGGPE
jgi:hypothetical protein